jgi:hypothetical protein
MPMALFVEDGELRVRQTFDAPTIYFDHWALCDFSEDTMLQNRFVKAMLGKRGTFVLSHTNLAEYTNPSDPRHAEAAERFLERLMPNVYLTDFDLEKAERFERQPDYAGQRMWPSADLPMLKFVAERSLAAGTGLSMMGFITLSHVYRERLSETFAQSNKNILAALNKQRADPAYVAKARRSVPDAVRPKTWVVMSELMRELTIDSNASITVNDIVDWQHAILPVSCCDYVLLDGKWEQRVRALTNRATQQGLHFTFAKCFSKRDNGLDRFLSELEAH